MSSSPTHAMSLSLTPVGSQIDGDTVLDIGTNIGTNIPVEVLLDTAGLNSPLNLTFRVIWDASELELELANTKNAGVGPFNTPDSITFCTPSPIFLFPPPPPCLPGRENFGFLESTYTGLSTNTTGKLWELDYQVLPGLVNDGSLDLSLEILSATSAIDITPSTEVQSVSVPEPSSFLSILTLGILGIAASHKKQSNRK
ncbi:MAG: PEP-CTERM sorting domain-containing protein [Spirulina sp.]